jgi:hypothetical protein
VVGAAALVEVALVEVAEATGIAIGIGTAIAAVVVAAVVAEGRGRTGLVGIVEGAAASSSARVQVGGVAAVVAAVAAAGTVRVSPGGLGAPRPGRYLPPRFWRR